MRSITQQEARNLFHYDNGKLIWKIKTSKKTIIGEEAGTTRSNDGYRQIMLEGKTWRTHRLIFLYHHGYMPKIVDHINNDRSDNRIENLREATVSQNGHNSKMRCDNTAGVKGVTWDKLKKKWMVRITANRLTRHLGRYSDFELAEFIANEARDFYHGEFARFGSVA